MERDKDKDKIYGLNIRHNEHKTGGSLDFDYISDGVYIGTNDCCRAGVAQILIDKGVTVDISLEKERIDSPFGTDLYVWVPIVDDTPPTDDQFDFVVAALKKLTNQKKTIYLHCLNGHGRSTTIFMGYLMREKNMNMEEAFNFIKKRRPDVHLSDPQYEFLMRHRGD